MARRTLSDLVLAGLDYGDVGGMDPFGVGAIASPLASRMALNPQLQQARQMAVQNAALAESMPAVVLPVDSVANVGAGLAAAIAVTPVSSVRITRFTVSPSVAGAFIINAMLAGRVNLFAGAGSVPADMFAPNSSAPPIEVPLVQAGTQIIVNVTNVSGAGARFIGSFSVIDLTLKLQGQ